MRNLTSLRAPLLFALAMLLPAAGLAQSTCGCAPGTYMGRDGLPLARSLANPAYSTCFCGQIVTAPAVAEIRNTADIEVRTARSRSLPEEEYVQWARAQERKDQERARLRAASIPRTPSDPIAAAAERLSGDGRTSAGIYRPRMEKGLLVLRGEVPTVWARDRALGLAADASGMEVRDELRVTSLGRPADHEIREEVERALDSAGYDDRKVVVMGGLVTTDPSVREGDEDLLLQIPGVRDVR